MIQMGIVSQNHIGFCTKSIFSQIRDGIISMIASLEHWKRQIPTFARFCRVQLGKILCFPSCRVYSVFVVWSPLPEVQGEDHGFAPWQVIDNNNFAGQLGISLDNNTKCAGPNAPSGPFYVLAV
jgi:hypothetical protein